MTGVLMTDVLVSASELLASDSELTVLDVRYRMGGPSGSAEFALGHVPGAAYVDLDRDLAAPPGVAGRHPLPAPDAFRSAMRDAAVCTARPVVVDDDWGGRAAARCWWLLRHYGHHDVRVLDGGWQAWQAAGGAIEEGQPPRPPGDFTGEPGQLRVLAVDDVLAFAGSGVLIDARQAARFRGEVEPVDPVAGHIPGAVNVPTEENLRPDGTFRPADEMREVYSLAGVEEGAEVGAYCGSGVTAAHDVLALATIGVDAALYPGSWSEWVGPTGGTATGRPVATSARP